MSNKLLIIESAAYGTRWGQSQPVCCPDSSQWGQHPLTLAATFEYFQMLWSPGHLILERLKMNVGV